MYIERISNRSEAEQEDKDLRAFFLTIILQRRSKYQYLSCYEIQFDSDLGGARGKQHERALIITVRLYAITNLSRLISTSHFKSIQRRPQVLPIQ